MGTKYVWKITLVPHLVGEKREALAAFLCVAAAPDARNRGRNCRSDWKLFLASTLSAYVEDALNMTEPIVNFHESRI